MPAAKFDVGDTVKVKSGLASHGYYGPVVKAILNARSSYRSDQWTWSYKVELQGRTEESDMYSELIGKTMTFVEYELVPYNDGKKGGEMAPLARKFKVGDYVRVKKNRDRQGFYGPIVRVRPRMRSEQTYQMELQGHVDAKKQDRDWGINLIGKSLTFPESDLELYVREDDSTMTDVPPETGRLIFKVNGVVIHDMSGVKAQWELLRGDDGNYTTTIDVQEPYSARDRVGKMFPTPFTLQPVPYDDGLINFGNPARIPSPQENTYSEMMKKLKAQLAEQESLVGNILGKAVDEGRSLTEDEGVRALQIRDRMNEIGENIVNLQATMKAAGKWTETPPKPPKPKPETPEERKKREYKEKLAAMKAQAEKPKAAPQLVFEEEDDE